MLSFAVITIFPEFFSSPLSQTILKRAQEKELISVRLMDPRNYTSDRHRVVDDYPYGGGEGMVMKPEPVVAAIEDARSKLPGAWVVLLTPRGRVFNQETANEWVRKDSLVFVSGRYEGVDERVAGFVDDEISIGDYTLSGGEPAALAMIDAVTRLIPGVLGNVRSLDEESFVSGLLEYPQYTRPEEFRGTKVPEVMLSGDHEEIKKWRREKSFSVTEARRPDLLRKARLARKQRQVPEMRAEVRLALIHHPVFDKNGEIVTTAITNMDIHDIARAARTYGVKRFYVVHPVRALQKLALKIIDHWETGYGSRYNETRKEALALASIKSSLDDVIIDIEKESGEKPILVATSARSGLRKTPFSELRDMLRKRPGSFLLLFGTGWGLAHEVLDRCDYVLEPVEGLAGYNHLSVRSAAAIILDRLLSGGTQN